MKLIMQPEGSSLCGQACVAMIAGITLEESIKVFGTKGGTHTNDLIRAFKRLGISCDNRPILIGPRHKYRTKPPICIVRQHFKDRKNTHWVVFYKGMYYDPSLGTLERYEDFFDDVRETSYLEIFNT
jgi:hypothetical protein